MVWGLACVLQGCVLKRVLKGGVFKGGKACGQEGFDEGLGCQYIS